MYRFIASSLCGLSVLACVPAWSQNTPIIANRSQVEQAIARGAMIWDVRTSKDYAAGHIPGAVSIGDAAAVLRDANREDFISQAAIEQLLGSAGIDPAKEIVVYGSRGTWNAYFGQYTVQYFGGKSATVYHDGIEDWVAAGKPVSTDSTKLAPLALKLTVDTQRIASTKEVIERLGKSEVQLIDARTEKEFQGDDIRAIRGGHIPGARNIPYENNWQDPLTLAKLARKQITSNQGMSLKSDADLRATYAGLDPNKETIVYCQSGARASETAGVLQHLGFKNVRVYDASWLGYGNTLDAPANNVTFVNVGAIQSRMQGLQNRVDQLEKELAKKAP
jgi:thiosulfate/3-mercaptopyruvate sulfurtransferase